MNILLDPSTELRIQQFITQPSHAVMLIAPNGAGKGTLARYLATRLLTVDPERLDMNPYFKLLVAPSGKSISIEQVREVTHFLMLKTTRLTKTTRVVLIEQAGSMTPQAQNALLKTIEEPPTGTVLILTAPNELDVLPTIRSRVQVINLTLPDTTALKAYFQKQGYTSAAIDKALLMSNGLPGLTYALLSDDVSHPLVAAALRARELLQKPLFERLLLVDELTKQKQDWLDTLFIIERIAEINLEKAGSNTTNLRRWHGVLKASYDATAQTLGSAQIKLVGLRFMLSI